MVIINLEGTFIDNKLNSIDRSICKTYYDNGKICKIGTFINHKFIL